MGKPDTPAPSSPTAHDRLDSWKEIAAYLEREESTARRWEREEGLPVHRHSHHQRSSVYARRAELDHWLAHRAPTHQQRPAPIGQWGRWAVVVAGIAAAGAVVVVFWPTPSAPPLEFAERDWVLITDFDNRTGEEVLDGTIKGALTRELSNSQFVNVVPRERIGDALRLMRQPVDARIDEVLGREISQRDGDIRAVLTGQVEKLDSTYLLSATIVDPTTGVTVASVTQEASEPEIVAAIRQLSNDVRQTLGEALSSIEVTDQQLAQVTTPSLRALQLYSQADAVIAGRGGPNGDAVAEALLTQAVADDPGFASAYTHLAWAVINQRRPPEDYRPYAMRAFELAKTASDRERYFIIGSYHHIFDRLDEAVSAYETLLRVHPDHYWATNNLGALYRRLGQQEQAIRLLLRKADLRPDDFLSNFFASHQTIQLGGDVTLARPYAARASQLESAGEGGVTGAWQLHWLALFPVYERWSANDPHSALDALTAVAESVRDVNGPGRDELAFWVGSAYTLLGMLETAEEVFRSVPEGLGRGRGLAEVAHSRGDLRAAREHLQNATLYDRAVMPYTETRWALEFLGNPSPTYPRIQVPLDQLIRGRVALAQGQTTAAISLLEASLQASPAAYHSCLVADLLARARRQQGDQAGALDVLDDCSGQRIGLLVGPAIPAVWWLRLEAEGAGLNRELGREVEAARIEAQLLKLLAVADADHQILREIKARQPAPQSAN